MRIFSYRRLRQLFSFASMGIARSGGRGIHRRHAFKQRRDAFSSWRVGNEQLEPRKMLAAATVSSTNWVNTGPVGQGDTIGVQVVFTEQVTGTGNVALDVGGQSRSATYSSGSGGTTLTYNYTVLSSDNDTDGVVATGLSGAFTNVQQELFDHDGDPATPEILVDVPADNTMGAALTGGPIVSTEDPTVVIVSDKTSVGGNTGSAVETAAITFTLSEGSDDFTVDDVTVANGQLSAFSGSGSSYTATFTPDEDSTTPATLNIESSKFTNAAGNLNDPATTLTIDVNTVRPTVTFSGIPTGTVGGTDTATITFTLSPASEDFEASDVTVSGGTMSALFGSGDTYTTTFTPDPDSTAEAAFSISAGAFTDSDGNENLAVTSLPITVNTVRPTVTITAPASTISGTNTATITFTLSADADTSTFTADDVDVSGGTLSLFAGSGSSYTATFTPPPNSTTTETISVAENRFVDTDGNENVAATPISIAVNTVQPTVAITSVPTSVGGTDVAVITFTLSAASTDFLTSDATATGGTLSALVGSGSSYTAIFTPTPGSTTAGVVSVAAGGFTDADGNQNLAATSLPITVDTEAPTVTISSDLSTLVIGQTANLTFALSEDSTTFTATDVLVTGGVLSNFVGAGKSYSATFTPTADTDATATININAGAFTDELGNENTVGATEVTITVDTTAPSVTVTSDKNSVGGNDGSIVETATITFTLSEPSDNFIASDVVVVNGSIGTLTANGTNDVYTATFTPDDPVNGTATVTVPASTLTDSNGNDNTEGQVSIAVNTVQPTIGIVSVPTSVGGTDVAVITFTLSAASTDFLTSDATATGGTLSALAGSGSSYTAIFTPTPGSTTAGAVSVAAGGFTDADGNQNLAATSLPITVDTEAPTVTISSDLSALVIGQTANLTFALSEDSTTFTAADVLVTGGVLSNFVGAGKSYSATFTPTADTDATATININAGAFTDELGNENTVGATEVTITVDTTAPSVTVTSDKNSVGGNDGSIVETATITFTLSEPSDNFIASDVVVVNGSIGTLTANGTNDVYTATFTPDDPVNGTATVTVPASTLTDSNGNDNTEGQVSIAVNTVQPTIGIVSVPTSVGGTDVAVITFTLSAASTDFVSGDVTATGGTLSALAGSGSSYTAIFTPTPGSTTAGAVSVAAGGFTDADGNENLAATSLPITVDTEAPTPAVAVNPDPIGGGETTTVTIDLGEDSTDFTIDDIVATGGTLSNFQSASAQIYTVDFTPSADSTGGTINISATVYTDAAGNSNNAATPGTIDIIEPPTITLDPVTAGGATEAEATGAGATSLLTVLGDTGNTVSVVFTNGANTVTVDVAGNGATPVLVNLTLVDLATLGDGTINVSATQQNPAGNISLAETASFLLDTAEPTITGITTNAGVLGGGDALTFTVIMSETVDVTGAPTLDFEIDGAARNATLTGGTGTNTLTFSYTVDGTVPTGDQNDTDGLTLTALTLNGGSISDEAGNDADLALPTTLVGAGTTFLMPQPVTLAISLQDNSVDASNPSGALIQSPRATPVSYIVLQFNDVVPFISPGTGSANGFLDLSDFELTVDGEVEGWPPQAEIEQDISDPTRYLITNLSDITETPGTYILTFSDVAISDEQEITWVKTVETPGELTAVFDIDPDDSSDPRQTAVDSATITFTESVVGVDLNDFELDVTDPTGAATATFGAGGGLTPWPSHVSIAADTTGIEYVISGLDLITSTDASYELRLIHDPAVTEIQTLAGGNLITPVSIQWDLDRSATIASITPSTPPASGFYKGGGAIEFNVQFSEIVEVAGGQPQLPLTLGTTNITADYVSGTGLNTLTFVYTVQDGDLDTNGLRFNGNEIILNGATINDVAGIAATLQFSPIDLSSQKVDAVAPQVSSVSGPNPGEYVTGDDLEFTITFDEPVDLTFTNRPQVSVTIGNTVVLADLVSTITSPATSLTTLTFEHTVGTADRSVTGLTIDSLIIDSLVTIKDAAGNEADSLITQTAVPSVVVNQVSATSLVPTAQDSIGNPKTSPTVLAEGDVFILTANFTDAVTRTGIPQIPVRIGINTVNAVYDGGSGGTAIEFRYIVANGDMDLDGISLPSNAIDLNGGSMVDSSGNVVSLEFSVPTTSGFKVDAIPPTNAPTVDALVADTTTPTITGTATLENGETLAVTVSDATYSVTPNAQNVWSLDLSTTPPPTPISGSLTTLVDGETYEVTATITDLATNEISDTSTEELVIDTSEPTVVGVTSTTPDGSYGVGQAVVINIQMSEDVTINTDLGSPTLTLDAGTANFTSAAGNILTFTYTSQEGDNSTGLDVTGLNANGEVIEDAAGNEAIFAFSGQLAAASNIVIDTEAPDAPYIIAQITNSTPPTITGGNSTLAADEVLTVVVNGATYEVDTFGGNTWSLDLAGSVPIAGTLGAFPDGTYPVTATVTDEVGNATSTGVANALVVDTTAPAAPTVDALTTNSTTPTITGTATLGDGETLTVEVYDSIGVVDSYSFGAVVQNTWSWATNFGLSNGTYEVTATITDLATNEISDTSTEELVIDTSEPTVVGVTSTTPDGSYGVGQAVVINIQMSEDVTINTDLGSPTLELDFGVGVTTTASFTSAAGNILTFTYTSQEGDDSPDLDVTNLNLNNAVIEDAAGNTANFTFSGELAAASDILIDTTAPDAPTVTPLVTLSTLPTLEGTTGALAPNAGEVLRVEVNGATYEVTPGPTTLFPTLVANEWKLNLATQNIDSGTLGAFVDNTFYPVTATLIDEAGNATSDSTTNELGINTDPIILSIAPATNTPDGFYDEDDTISIEITVSQPVRVSGGQPEINLNSGLTAVAKYVGDSTSYNTTLLFQYTVENGDDSADLDYDDSSSLNLNGATIVNQQGKPLFSTTLDPVGSINSISFANDIVVNTAPPQVLSVNTNAPDGEYGIGNSIRIFATLSEAVPAGNTLELILDTAANRTVTLTTDGTTKATGDYVVQAGDTSTDLSVLATGATNIVDHTGNPLTSAAIPGGQNLQDNKDIIIDTDRPTIKSFTSTTPDGLYGVGGSIALTATTNEDVRQLSSIEVTLNNNATVRLVASTLGTTLTGTYIVSQTDLSAADLTVASITPIIVLDVAGNDLQDTTLPVFDGNLGDTSDIEIDTAPPSIVSISAPDGLYGLTGTIDITVQLTEVLTAAQDITLTFDTGATLTLTTDGTDTLTGIYTVGTGEDSADLTVTKAEAVGTVVDAAGNSFFGLLPTGTNLGDTSDVVVDTAAPTVMSITPDVTTLNSASAPAVLTIILGEDSADFDVTDLTDTAGGTFANLTGTGSNYTVEFTPSGSFEGTTTITVSNGAFTDLAGNAYATDGTSASIDVDTLAPTITGIASPVSLAKSGTATVTFTVSESTANFDDLDLVTTGGTLTALAGAVPGTTYTATFTPTDDVNSGTGLISIAGGVLTDSAGNPNLASSVTILYDTQAPTVTITSDKASVGGNDGSDVEEATITFTLSEPSTDFIASDVVVVNGSIGTLTANGTNDVYTATFTPNSDFNGTATVDINAGAFTDPVGNSNAAATQETIAVNTVRPTISISSAPTTPIGGPNTATVTFTLSAASADFTRSDVIVSDGTLTGFSGSGASYTALFTPPANSTTTETISVAENVFTDGDGNGNTAATPASILVDTVAPSAPGISLSSSATGPIINFAEATSPLGLIDVTGDAGATINVVFTGVNGSVPVSVSGPSGVAILTAGNLTTLGDGPVAVTATQTDAAGNESLASNTINLELDATPPVVIGFASDKPAGHYKSAETFNLTASLSEQVSAGQNFAVTLNTGAAVLFTAPADGLFLEGTYVVIGNHNANPLAVTSILSAGTTEDDAGNALSTQLPAQSTFAGIVIDTVAPDQAVLSLLATDPVSADEAVASTGFATVRGEAGATIVVTIANTTGQQVQRTLLGDGTDQLISLTLAELPILGEGLMTISASQTDEAGNAQTAPVASIPFTLDTTAPSTLALTPGAGVADGATEAEATQVTGVARLTGEAGASVTITITDADGNEVVLDPIIATGAEQAVRKTLTDLSQLADGVIIVSAVQTDAAGNTNAIPVELTFTLDRVAPADPPLSLTSGVTTPLTYAEATTTNGVVNVQGESGSEILVVFQGQNGTLSRNLTGTGSNEAIVLSDNDVTTILGEGVVTVSATQTDQAGNTSSVGTLPLEIDQTNPEVNSLVLIGSGPYGPLSKIPVEGTLSEQAVPGQILNVILNVLDGVTPVVVPVTVGLNGTDINGIYEVQAGHNTDDLTIDGHTNDDPSNPVTDLAGNLLLDSSSNSGSNLKTLGGGSAGTLSTGIIIDTTPPEITEWLPTADTYIDGDDVLIQVRISEAAMPGTTISVRPNTLGALRPSIELTLDSSDSTNTLYTGTYTVALGESTQGADLTVTVDPSTILTDLAGNALVIPIPATQIGVIIDGSVTLAAEMEWGPNPGNGYSTVSIELSTGVTGMNLGAFELTHNGRTISLRGASLVETDTSNYVLVLPPRIASMTGDGFIIAIFSSDILSIAEPYTGLENPLEGDLVLPDPGMNTNNQGWSR